MSRKRWSESQTESNPARFGARARTRRSSPTAAATRPRPSSRTAGARARYASGRATAHRRHYRWHVRSDAARTLHACSSACRTCPRARPGRARQRSRAACGPALARRARRRRPPPLGVHARRAGRRRRRAGGAVARRARWPSTSTSPGTTACIRGSARSTSCRSSPSAAARRRDAVDAARAFASVGGRRRSRVPVFLYDDADPDGAHAARRPPRRVRRARARLRAARPHPTLGAAAVGARDPLVAVNCELARDDVGARPRDRARGARARRRTARRARARLHLDSVEPRAGVDEPRRRSNAPGCRTRAVPSTRSRATPGTEVARVELVGLAPGRRARALRRRLPRVVGHRRPTTTIEASRAVVRRQPQG